MVSNIFQVFLICLGLGNARDIGELNEGKYNLLTNFVFTVVFYLIIARKLWNLNNMLASQESEIRNWFDTSGENISASERLDLS